MRLSRGGFTLAELLVATAIAGVAATLMVGTMVRQQRFYASAAVMLDTRAQLRDAADVLATDIRSAAASSYGFPVMSDSAIEMFTTIATSVACSVPVGSVIALPPAALSAGNTLTSILVQPDTGDVALVYSVPPGAPDSAQWEERRIVAFATRSTAAVCPASTGFTTAADAAAPSPSYAVTLAGAPGANVRAGTPIHFIRRARYSLYRSSDHKWYLGYRRCGFAGPSACAAVQPVSGPYRAYGTNGASGLSFRYYDASGSETSASNAVARIEIVLRGESVRTRGLTGDTRVAYRDSVVVSVSPRNRLR